MERLNDILSIMLCCVDSSPSNINSHQPNLNAGQPNGVNYYVSIAEEDQYKI